MSFRKKSMINQFGGVGGEGGSEVNICILYSFFFFTFKKICGELILIVRDMSAQC